MKITPYTASLLVLAGIVLLSQPVLAQASAAPGLSGTYTQTPGTTTNAGTLNSSSGAATPKSELIGNGGRGGAGSSGTTTKSDLFGNGGNGGAGGSTNKR